MLKYSMLEAPSGAVSVKAAAFGPQGYVIHHGDALALEGARRVMIVPIPNDFCEFRLLAALANICPEAAEPVERAESLAVAAGEPATGGGASSQIEPLEPRLAGIRDVERDDDEGEPYRVPSCSTGGCGDD